MKTPDETPVLHEDDPLTDAEKRCLDFLIDEAIRVWEAENAAAEEVDRSDPARLPVRR
jgi:hypothetical protein